MFKKRNIKKNYLAFTYGVLNQRQVEINKNISRNKIQRTKFNVSDDIGKQAITKVSNVKTFIKSRYYSGFINSCRNNSNYFWCFL